MSGSPAPAQLRHLWPALAARIDNASAHVIHVPFKLKPIKSAIGHFDHENYPLGGGLVWYSVDAHKQWGLVANTAYAWQRLRTDDQDLECTPASFLSLVKHTGLDAIAEVTGCSNYRRSRPFSACLRRVL